MKKIVNSKKTDSVQNKLINQVKIVFEDNDVIAINKPSGLIVNRSNTTNELTLQDFLDEKFLAEKGSYTGFPEEFAERSGLVHRLDKDTSGLILAAKNFESMKKLQSQFKSRFVDKEYCAIVIGNIQDEIIEIVAPIKRNPKAPLKYAVVSTGKEAKTRITKVKDLLFNNIHFTYINIFPHTGRTHQIRVHLSAIRHPVAHDEIYCTKKEYELSQRFFNRLMLHSRKIMILHPKTNKELTIEAKLPTEFNEKI